MLMLRIPSRFCSAVVILGLCLGVPASRAAAQANLPLYEAFDYGAGNLVGNALEGTPWTETGTQTASPIQVSNGSLTYSGLPASVGGKITLGNGSNYEDAGLDIVGQTSGTLYASFVLNVLNPGTASTGDGIFHFSSAGPSATDLRSLVWIKYGDNVSKFRLGLRATSSSSTSFAATQFDVGTPVFVVVAYQFIAGRNNDKAQLWVNPPLKQPIPTTPDIEQTVSSDLATLGRVGLRQGQSNSGLSVQLDELRVDTSWTYVTCPVTISRWSLE
jgi:hypothetical protein